MPGQNCCTAPSATPLAAHHHPPRARNPTHLNQTFQQLVHREQRLSAGLVLVIEAAIIEHREVGGGAVQAGHSPLGVGLHKRSPAREGDRYCPTVVDPSPAGSVLIKCRQVADERHLHAGRQAGLGSWPRRSEPREHIQHEVHRMSA